jgi:LppX_LprAFG lipoprotein
MRRALAGAAMVLTLVACGGGQAPAVDATKVLRDGAAAMASLKTVSASVKLTKGSITIQGFTLVSAQTAVRLPADSDTKYTVREQDVLITIEVIISGGHVYLHVPFSPLQEITGAGAAAFPDMAKLFDSSTGLPAVIPAGASPKYVSTEKVDGHDSYQVSTSYTPDQVHSLLATLNSSGPVAARVWVDVSDHLIRKAVLDGAFGDAGKQAVVEVDITNFDGAVIITSPSP